MVDDTKPTSLMDDMDVAAKELLKSITGHTMGDGSSEPKSESVAIEGQIEAFEAVTAYLAVKHKIQPSGAGQSGIDRYRDRINGGASGRRNRGSRAAAANGSTQPAADPSED